MSLYVDAHGLHITSFVVQRWTGATWQTASIYEPSKKYRFRMLVRNSFRTGIPQLGPAFGNTGIHITSILVKFKLAGARFEETGRDWSNAFLMPRVVDGHPDFNDTIAPGKSRWFDLGIFTWTKTPAQLSKFPVELNTGHRQIIYMPAAPVARLVPS